MQLGHLLTRSGLTYPEVSSKVYHDSFCNFGSCVSLGTPRRRWEDNIKMDLREVQGDGDLMELGQDRDRWRALANTVMNFRVP